MPGIQQFVTALGVEREHIALVTDHGQLTKSQLRDRASAISRQLVVDQLRCLAVVAQSTEVVLTAIIAGQMSGADVVLLRNRWPGTEKLLSQCSTDAELQGDFSVSRRQINYSHKSQSRVVLTTSGTTGDPKPVVHSLTRLMGRIKPPPRSAKTARWLLTYDPASFAGLQVSLTALSSNGTLHIPKGFNAADIASMAISCQPTHISGTPTLWRSILVALGNSASQLPLRRITLGGEIADQSTLDRLHTVFPQAGISHIYASTEAGSVFTVKDGRAGFPSKWLESTVDGVQLRINSKSVLEINSPRRMERYASEGHRADDWIDTGDIVTHVDDRILFVGREDCVINVGGGKVWPETVESVLCSVPGIAEAFVYGKRNALLGALVMADIVVSPGHDSSTVIKTARLMCSQKLQRHETPQRLRQVMEIGAGETGKKVRGR